MDSITDFSLATGQADKIDLVTVPSNVFGNRGSITASTLQAALQQAFDDCDITQSGNQALQSNEAVVFNWGPSSRQRNNYVAVSDGVTGFSNDLLIKLPNAIAGTIDTTTFI